MLHSYFWGPMDCHADSNLLWDVEMVLSFISSLELRMKTRFFVWRRSIWLMKLIPYFQELHEKYNKWGKDGY
jgi:hypothetical protein